MDNAETAAKIISGIGRKKQVTLPEDMMKNVIYLLLTSGYEIDLLSYKPLTMKFHLSDLGKISAVYAERFPKKPAWKFYRL